MRNIIRLKCAICVLAFVFIGQSLSARVKYDKSMEPFIGVWTMQDKLGNDYEYKFQVVDGWVVLRYRFVDNYSQGSGMSASRKKNIDYRYEDGCFHYNDDHPESEAYNSISLYLKEGSLVESNRHHHPGSNTTYINTYEKE
jgi:hypothetical protein